MRIGKKSRQTEEKKVKIKKDFCVFRNTITFKVMKAISYKKKLVKKSSFICPKEALDSCNYSKYVLRLQKSVTIRQKSKNSLLFC